MGRTKLDYNYGIEDQKVNDVETVITNDTPFIVKDKKGNVVKVKDSIPKRIKLPADIKTHKYLHYEEYITPDELEVNGYKYNKDDNFERLDIKGWNTFVGFMAIRIASPMILLIHAIASGIYVYLCGFDFGPEGPLAKGPYGGIGVVIILSLSFHAFLVHALNKWLFSGTYWKKRVEYENERRNRADVTSSEIDSTITPS